MVRASSIYFITMKLALLARVAIALANHWILFLQRYGWNMCLHCQMNMYLCICMLDTLLIEHLYQNLLCVFVFVFVFVCMCLCLHVFVFVCVFVEWGLFCAIASHY